MLLRAAWLYGSLTVVCVLLFGAPAQANVTVTGDRSAYDEVVAAFKKLFSLPGFRAKGTNTQGQSLLEYAAPDNWHFGVQGGQYGYEIIKVGGQVATRANMPGQAAGWRCRAAKNSDHPIIDPTSAEGTYDVSRGPDTVIDGSPMHTIVWMNGGKRTSYYVGTQNGLPKRATGGDDTIDYYDYGARVVIALPSCAQ